MDWLDAMYDDPNYDPDPYGDVAEARREEAMDRFDAVAWECEDCGERWDPRWHRATRTDPAYVEVDTCPNCGGQPR